LAGATISGYEDASETALSQLLDAYELDRPFWKSDPSIAVLGDPGDAVLFPGCPERTVDLVLGEITQRGNKVIFHSAPEAATPRVESGEETEQSREPAPRQEWLRDEAIPSLMGKTGAEGLLWGWCDSLRNYEDHRVDMYLNLSLYGLDDELLGEEMAHIRTPAFSPPKSQPKAWIETLFPGDAEVFAGDQLRFSAHSTDRYSGWITRYTWHFGDPGSSGSSDECSSNTTSERETCHRFSGPGEYRISLSVIDNEKLTGKAELVLSVADFRKPRADIIVPSVGDRLYACKKIDFRAIGKSAYPHQTVSVRWDFGDKGTAGRRGRDPCCPPLGDADNHQVTHCYEEPGHYTVALSVSDAHKEAEATRNIRIHGTRIPRVKILKPREGAVFDYQASVPFEGKIGIDTVRSLRKYTLRLGSRGITSLRLSPSVVDNGWKTITIGGNIQLLGHDTGPTRLSLIASDEVSASSPEVIGIRVKTEKETEMDRVGFRDPVIEYEVVEIDRPASDGGPFWIGLYEVSAEQWNRIIGDGIRHEECNLSGAMPATCVSFSLSLRFVDRVNELLSQANSRRRYRLPKEVEWEYACRAGGDSEYGFAEPLTPGMANFRADAQGARGPRYTHDFDTNGVGVASMHGNVMEWVTPGNPAVLKKRIAKGGAWITSKRGLACSKRYFIGDSDRYEPYFGLRLVAETHPAKE